MAMRAASLPLTVLILVQALLIAAPFAILGPAIDWPASLRLPPETVLPLIHAKLTEVRTGYGLYLVYSLLFAVTGALIVAHLTPMGSFGAIGLLAVVFAGVSSLARAIGIIRWLTATPALATAYADPATSPSSRAAIEATQLAVNAYGGAIGEFLGVALFAGLWLGCVSLLIVRHGTWPRWFGWIGFPAALAVAAPALALVGIEVPGGVALGSSVLHLWLIAAAVLTALVRRPR